MIESLDHLVLTVADIDVTCAFYERILGMTVVTFGVEQRRALQFGSQKINLHELSNEFEPKANQPTSGSADLCFLTNKPINAVVAHLHRHGIPIVDGPVARTGATGPLISIYLRDPDLNLLEISNLQAQESAS